MGRGGKGTEEEGSYGGKGLVGLRHEERGTVVRSRADTGAEGVQSAAPCSRCGVQGLAGRGSCRGKTLYGAGDWHDCRRLGILRVE